MHTQLLVWMLAFPMVFIAIGCFALSILAALDDLKHDAIATLGTVTFGIIWSNICINLTQGFIGFVVYVIFAATLGTTTDFQEPHTNRIDLVSLRDQSQYSMHGGFILGSGSIDGNTHTVYVSYEHMRDGSLHRIQFNADVSYLLLDAPKGQAWAVEHYDIPKTSFAPTWMSCKLLNECSGYTKYAMISAVANYPDITRIDLHVPADTVTKSISIEGK